MRRLSAAVLAAVAALLLPGAASAMAAAPAADEARATPGAEDPLFSTLEPLALTLSAPLRDLSRDRADEPEYRPAQLSLTGADGDVRTFEIGVRPRGRSRRDKEVCTFPPLRLNFKKQDVDGTEFHGQDKLKLVTHCRTSSRHLRFVYREYLAYRLLNQVTDASFRVRPLEVTYESSIRNARPVIRFGFFIEDKDRAARRLGLEVVDVDSSGIEPGRLHAEHAALMELFQFLIGNTDFSFLQGPANDECCHNAVLMADREGRYLAFPYDFDITGIVNPPYAVVDYRLPLQTVRQRLYRGFCRESAVMSRAMDRFRAARPAMMTVIATETALDDRGREDVREYVEEFFAILDDPRERRRKIEEACRG